MKIVYSNKYLKYNFGENHPFSSSTRGEFYNLLKDDKRFEFVRPTKACDSDILLVHTREYLSRLKEAAKGGGGYLSVDTPVNKGNLEAAYYYVGGTVLASKISLKDGLAVNTLGGLHHAQSNNSSGFCIFNDHAIAIKKLQIEGEIKKAAVLDLDVHAGNGTQEIFYADPTVLTVSIHQDPSYFYPGTGFSWQEGVGRGKGFNINHPLFAGTSEKEYLPVVEKALVKIRKFKPDIMFVVSGVDTYKNDQLGSFKLEKETYGKIAFRLNSLTCGKQNKLPMVILFAGGYSDDVPELWLEIVNNL
ncbi:histone deacetylase family protein [Patescibacteria group bacterium]